MQQATATATPSSVTVVSFIFLTIALFVGLGVAFTSSFRASVAAAWETRRCEPGVLPIAGLFKPDGDPRTAAAFAADNWRECQKEFVQTALSSATAATRLLATEQAATAELTQGLTDDLAGTFVDLWRFCYEAYSTFMTNMGSLAKLFHNQLIGIHTMVGRMNAAITSLVFGLVSTIAAFVSGIQLVVTITIIVVGILLIMQILLFFLLMPISSLILSMSALVMSVAVMVATTVAAVSVGEMFDTGACFAPGTRIVTENGATEPIERIRLGTRLCGGGEGGGTVTAIHEFWRSDRLFDLHGVRVTGDHLVAAPAAAAAAGAMHPVSQDPRAVPLPPAGERAALWCLTTSNRIIPVLAPTTSEILRFADWEEIPQSDLVTLRKWFVRVWGRLNETGAEAPSVPDHLLTSADSGMTPECRVAVRTVSAWWSPRGYRWVPISEIRPGDEVATNACFTEFTLVTGRVTRCGSESHHSVRLGTGICGEHQRVSAGTWIRHGGRWQLAGMVLPTSTTSSGGRSEEENSPWIHLYTATGHFMLEGGWTVRDASDVGLDALDDLVEETILDGDGDSDSKTKPDRE